MFSLLLGDPFIYVQCMLAWSAKAVSDSLTHSCAIYSLCHCAIEDIVHPNCYHGVSGGLHYFCSCGADTTQAVAGCLGRVLVRTENVIMEFIFVHMKIVVYTTTVRMQFDVCLHCDSWHGVQCLSALCLFHFGIKFCLCL